MVEQLLEHPSWQTMTTDCTSDFLSIHGKRSRNNAFRLSKSLCYGVWPDQHFGSFLNWPVFQLRLSSSSVTPWQTIQKFCFWVKNPRQYLSTQQDEFRKTSCWQSKRMDEAELFHLVQQCEHLKFRFRGVFAADNFPKTIRNGSFMIVDASIANHLGTHWTLIYHFKNSFYFADPLGFPLKFYQGIKRRLGHTKAKELLLGRVVQPVSSDKCGLFVYL